MTARRERWGWVKKRLRPQRRVRNELPGCKAPLGRMLPMDGTREPQRLTAAVRVTRTTKTCCQMPMVSSSLRSVLAEGLRAVELGMT